MQALDSNIKLPIDYRVDNTALPIDIPSVQMQMLSGGLKKANDGKPTNMTPYIQALLDIKQRDQLLRNGNAIDNSQKTTTPIVNKTIGYSDTGNKVYVNSKGQNYFFDSSGKAQLFKGTTKPSVNLDDVVGKAKNVKDLAEKFNDNPADLNKLLTAMSGQNMSYATGASVPNMSYATSEQVKEHYIPTIRTLREMLGVK